MPKPKAPATERTRQEAYEGRMQFLRQVWQDGAVAEAVAEAVHACREFEQVPPEWVEAAVAKLLYGDRQGERTRRHFLRWFAVTSERAEGRTWDIAYEAAAQSLRGGEAAGTADAIKKSYQLVQRDLHGGKDLLPHDLAEELVNTARLLHELKPLKSG